MNFPGDHYGHFGKYDFEWFYFWGKLNTGQFFHFVEHHIKFGNIRVQSIHHSLDGKFYEELKDWKSDIISTSGYAFERFTFNTPYLQLTLFQKSDIMIHKTKMEDRNYYSIPHLEGKGHLNGQKVNAVAWFDHEFSQFKDVPNWDWVTFKLNCGLYGMVWDCSIEPICEIFMNGGMKNSDFILENKHLFINDFGMYLTLEPIYEEIIFKPRIGIKYSEQPFEVLSKGKAIGEGMRERTYHQKEN